MLKGFVAQHPSMRQRWTRAAVLITRRARRRAGPVLVAAARTFDVVSIGSGVCPRRRVVVPGLGIEAGEQTAEIFCVAEVFVDQRGGVRVGDDILLEPEVIGEDVVDERAE